MIKKLQNKSALAIEFAVVEALRNKAKTITSDNGNEFTNHQTIAQKVNADYYFANPYASYERGSIENLNGLIRQYIPKGSDLDAIEQDQLDIIADKLNNRPRKILNFLSPLEYTSKFNTIQKNLDLSHLRV
jgi:IS30 family transposase